MVATASDSLGADREPASESLRASLLSDRGGSRLAPSESESGMRILVQSRSDPIQLVSDRPRQTLIRTRHGWEWQHRNTPHIRIRIKVFLSFLDSLIMPFWGSTKNDTAVKKACGSWLASSSLANSSLGSGPSC